MVTAETSATRDTRTMYAAVPQPLTGPTDPTIQISHLYASSLSAVGVCVPRSDDRQITAELSRVYLWRVDRGGQAHRVVDAVVTDWPLYALGEAYWAPPPGQGDTWPAGTYVFEILPMDDGPSRWMGVQFIPTSGAVARQP